VSDSQPNWQRANYAVGNLIVMCAEVSRGNWELAPGENLILAGDPGFIDAARGDFRLRPDAEIYSKLSGFQPIPFEEVGLYADELRPSSPEEPWDYTLLSPVGRAAR